MHKYYSHGLSLIDCTLRDGGYYNNWDFDFPLVSDYLQAMVSAKVDFVEVGLRSLKNQGFKGGFAYSKDAFLKSLDIPAYLKNKIAVMVNASELVGQDVELVVCLEKLFAPKSESPVSFVRIACHVHEFEAVLPAATWLKEQGYFVGFNLMQIADRTDEEIISLAKCASNYPVDVLYFADSMGSLNPQQVSHIVSLIRQGWAGEIGIHTHDNMNQALANSIKAVECGVTWVDATVTGMGRGPGNVQTEYLVLALSSYRKEQSDLTKLLELTRRYFKPMQTQCGWGTNPYYYLGGKYGIHPTYIQEMLIDSRFSDEDILAVIEYLRYEGGKTFDSNTLDIARRFYRSESSSAWCPVDQFAEKEVLLLGAGPSVARHSQAIKEYINQNSTIVLALNTQSDFNQDLIDFRIACHPIRLLADCETHLKLPQPLITPASMLPSDVLNSLSNKVLFDFGLQVEESRFEVKESYCVLPNALVLSYALAVLVAGKAKRILLAGFDGYGADDPRRKEVDHIFELFMSNFEHCPLLSVTPTRYQIPVASVYGLIS